mmetsp:Transcript_38076/g.59450  ORF Transcript_38076/g.59450 Transcript_38076/m.59450 type:complete len:426 (-) Transcript_38076:338-1615(-)
MTQNNRCKLRWLVTVLLVVALSVVSAEQLALPKNITPNPTKVAKLRPKSIIPQHPALAVNGGVKETATKAAKAGVSITSHLLQTALGAAVTLYGLGLLMHADFYPNQIHTITLMRAFGFDACKKMFQKFEANFLEARETLKKERPALLEAKASLKTLREKQANAKKIKKEQQKALADGVISVKEHAKLKELQEKHDREVTQEVEKLKAATSSLGLVVEALDIDAALDIFHRLTFMTMAVFASGSINAYVSKAINLYCLAANLGAMLNSLFKRLGFPLSRVMLALQRALSSVVNEGETAEEREAAVRQRGVATVYAAAVALALWPDNFYALKLNAGLIGGTVVLWGLAEALHPWLPAGRRPEGKKRPLKGLGGGFLLLGLAAAGLYSIHQDDKLLSKKGVPIPHHVLDWVETGLSEMVQVIEIIEG